MGLHRVAVVLTLEHREINSWQAGIAWQRRNRAQRNGRIEMSNDATIDGGTGDGINCAEVGYAAYAVSTGGKTFDGRDMPEWPELPDSIKSAWGAAAEAIIRAGMGKGLITVPMFPSSVAAGCASLSGVVTIVKATQYVWNEVTGQLEAVAPKLQAWPPSGAAEVPK
jgi:hypothetical protein